jgi:hypothetical protein
MNHSYETPQEGTLDWHVPLNDNFRQLDRDVEIRDADSNRGSYDPVDGGKYLATDTGRVYIGDGSTWNYLGDVVPERTGSSDASGGIHSARTEGDIAVVYEGGIRTIDPGSSTTPVQDAMDIAGQNGGGEVYLPFERVEDEGPIVFHNDCGLYGQYGNSGVKITGSGNDGFVFDAYRSDYSSTGAGENYIYNPAVEGVTLVGQGVTANTGRAVNDAGSWRRKVGQLHIRDWNGVVWEQSGPTFACIHDYILFSNVDAGDAPAIIYCTEYGAPDRYGVLEAYPVATNSGQDSDMIASDPGFNAHFDVVNLGGNMARVFRGVANGFSVSQLAWEPGRQNGTPEYLVEVEITSNISIDSCQLILGETRHVYSSYLGQSSTLAYPDVSSEANVTGALFNVKAAGNTDNPIVYGGSSSTISGDTTGIVALGDMA